MAVATTPASSATAASKENRLYNQMRREAISRANRVLMAVGPEYILPKPEDGEDLTTAVAFERYGLVNDLGFAEHHYYMAVNLRGVSKQRRQKIERGIKAAEYLRRLLKEEPICISDDRGIGKLDPLYPITKLNDLIYQLRARSRSRREHESGLEYSVEKLQIHERSAIEWLTGVELPKIFKQYLRMEAKVERNPNRNAVPRPPMGPYIRFARQFLIEFDIRQADGQLYTDETIAKALTDVRSGRRRRKG
jgi:hypothetical protein